ncbi:MAG: EamA family transporter [Proteobacteria bacterium]|nr:EamA family transporter [Pseudomonadota bacterium]
MSVTVFAVVMVAALLHASWNAIVKSAPDKFLSTVLVTGFAAALSIAVLPLLPPPARASWPFAATSAVLQVVYFVLVALTYRVADLSQTYPIMRGTAPLLVATFTAITTNEVLSRTAWLGVLTLCCGIFSMAVGSPVRDRKGIYLALLNAVVIAAYTLVDGWGVRRSGAPAAYTLCVFMLTGIPLVLWTAVRHRRAVTAYARRYWLLGIAGAMGTTASYGLALWAMTLAPVAIIAALRETAILFATLIAWLVLKERIGVRRIVGACIIAGGAALLRLA